MMNPPNILSTTAPTSSFLLNYTRSPLLPNLNETNGAVLPSNLANQTKLTPSSTSSLTHRRTKSAPSLLDKPIFIPATIFHINTHVAATTTTTTTTSSSSAANSTRPTHSSSIATPSPPWVPHATLLSKHLKRPGGFRQYHVLRHRPPRSSRTLLFPPFFSASTNSMSSFFDFMQVYGYFAGDCLWNEEEYEKPSSPSETQEDLEEGELQEEEEEVEEEEEANEHLVHSSNVFLPSFHTLNTKTSTILSIQKDEEIHSKDTDPLLPSSKLSSSHSLLHLPSSSTSSSTFPLSNTNHTLPILPSRDSIPSNTNALNSSNSRAFHPRATASSKKVFFLLLKSFIGTGVLFLPSAFRDGGFVFSFCFLIFIAFLSAHGMALLAKVNLTVPGSFGEMARRLYGPWLQSLVMWSIALSQMGFCMAYMVFITQNAISLISQLWPLTTPAPSTPSSLSLLINNPNHFFSFFFFFSSSSSSSFTYFSLLYQPWFWIGVQMIVYVPLAWVRRIKYFAPLSLLADVFILFGLAVVVYTSLATLRVKGIAPDVVAFNSTSFPFYIGTSVYTFEGVGLVLPIAQAMRAPSKFPSVLYITMILTTLVYLLVASVGYLAYGTQVHTIVLQDLKTTPFWTFLVYFFYILAIMLTWPLVVFPVIRILEHHWLPNANGKASNVHKWQKNLLRSALVLLLGTLAYFCTHVLHQLVALIGSFACIPLSFIYPSLLHQKAYPNASNLVRGVDWFMVFFGSLAMVYVTYYCL